MTSRPILFGPESIRAIRAGRKTETRRVVTVPWHKGTRTLPYEPYYADEDGVLYCCDEHGQYHVMGSGYCPYGRPGDRLWIREAYRLPASVDHLTPAQAGEVNWTLPPIWYEADKPAGGHRASPSGTAAPGRYRHARFMPRWASRTDLLVVETRCERLQAITEESAIAEGADPQVGPFGESLDYRGGFEEAWRWIHGKRVPWRDNPWVWVVRFEEVTP